MRMNFSGDSYDIVKRFFMNTIAPDAQWTAIPMFNKEPVQGIAVPEILTDEVVAPYKSFLGVDVASKEWMTKATDRNRYFSIPSSITHVFVDPDTGIRLKSGGGEAATHYVFAEELGDLCMANPGRLLLVFDQSIPRGTDELREKCILEKLTSLRMSGLHCFAYNSHACFVILSRTEEICRNAYDLLLAAHLPQARLLKAVGW